MIRNDHVNKKEKKFAFLININQYSRTSLKFVIFRDQSTKKINKTISKLLRYLDNVKQHLINSKTSREQQKMF